MIFLFWFLTRSLIKMLIVQETFQYFHIKIKVKKKKKKYGTIFISCHDLAAKNVTIVSIHLHCTVYRFSKFLGHSNFSS